MKKVYFLFLFVFLHYISFSKNSSIPLSTFIQWVEEKHDIHFSYDPALVKGVMVTTELKRLPNEKLWSTLSKETGFLFKVSSDNHVLIIPRKKVHQVYGKVIDAETKEALIGVIIRNKSGSKAVYSDVKGSFNLGKDLSAEDTIYIRYIGYKTQSIPSRLFFDHKTIFLENEVNVLNEVVITSYMTHGIQLMEEGQHLEFLPKQLTQIPGEAQGDVLQAIQALPGINTTNGKAGSFNIRGSSVDQSLVLIDDIPLYYRGHVFGTVSPFNPIMAEKVKIYRSGPTVNLGGTVGGAVSIETPKKNIDTANYAFYTSTTSFGVYTHQPLIKNKLSLYLSARSAYPTNWLSPKLSNIASTGMLGTIYSYTTFSDSLLAQNLHYYFGDVNAKLNYQVHKNSLLSLSFLGYTDKIQGKTFDAIQDITINETFFTRSWGLSMAWRQKFSERTNAHFKLIRSVFENDNIAFTPLSSQVEDNHYIKQTKLMTELNYRIKKTSKLTLGYEYDPTRLHNMTINDSITSGGRQISTNQAFYANYGMKLIPKLYVNVGLRMTYTPFIDFLIPEPRFFANYQLSDHWRLKASASRHSQLITQAIFFDFDDFNSSDRTWIFTNSKDHTQISTQYMLGTFWKKKAWQADIELFYKKTNNIRTIEAGDMAFSFGDANSYGVDIMLSRNVHKLSTWFNFSYLKTTWHFDRISEDPILAYYDQPLSFSLNSNYTFKKRLVCAIGWNIKSGVPNQFINTGTTRGLQTNINARTNNHLPDQAVTTPIDTGASVSYYGRLRTFHQLDLSMEYKFYNKKKTCKGTLGLSILNLYNRKNVIELVSVDAFRIGELERTTVGIAPELYLDLRF